MLYLDIRIVYSKQVQITAPQDIRQGERTDMIGRLRGEVVEKEEDKILIEVNGVGYDVLVSIHTLNALPDEGEAILHIHTHVREDTLQLMGFSTLDERDLFRLLIQVSGIGPRMGMNVLSHITPSEFSDTIKRENIKRLTSIPGIGKRTAERVILELRDKVIDLELGMNAAELKQAKEVKTTLRDLHSALLNFGYRPPEVERVIAQMESEAQSGVGLQELVMIGLKKLNKQ